MGRRIGPKTWDRIVEFFGDFWAVRVSNSALGLLNGHRILPIYENLLL